MKKIKKVFLSVIVFAPRAMIVSAIWFFAGAVLLLLNANFQVNLISYSLIALSMALFASGVIRYWFYKRDIPKPIHLMFKTPQVTFGEIADTVSANYPKIYSREEVLYNLLKPVWKGEFEWSSGAFGQLSLEGEEKQDVFTKKIKIIKSKDMYRPAHSDVRPLLVEVNRRDLLKADLGIQRVYPGFDHLQEDIMDEDAVSWSELTSKIDFDFLATLRPDDYSRVYIKTFIEDLSVNGPTVQSWFQRFQSGCYDD